MITYIIFKTFGEGFRYLEEAIGPRKILSKYNNAYLNVEVEDSPENETITIVPCNEDLQIATHGCSIDNLYFTSEFVENEVLDMIHEIKYKINLKANIKFGKLELRNGRG